MLESDCEQILGSALRPLFNQELSAERLESLIVQAHGLTAQDLQRRQDRDLFRLDWHKDGVGYTAGLQGTGLVFVNMHFAPGQLPAHQVIACLGSPHWYQAWYNSYVESGFSSVGIALVFPSRQIIAYGSQHYPFSSDQAPAIDDRLPVTMISLFGTNWQEGERVLAREAPWPGDWQQLQVDVTLHHNLLLHSDRDQSKDAIDVSLGGVLAEIDRAFTGVPRPPDEELLHPDAYDDSDIQALLGVPHWKELPDASVEYEYSALAFLSPAGFRHFLPAYLSWVLRHPDSDAAVVSSTIFALAPAAEEPLRSFMISKFSLLDDAQRAAVVLFLRAMVPFEDVRAALDYWLPRPVEE